MKDQVDSLIAEKSVCTMTSDCGRSRDFKGLLLRSWIRDRGFYCRYTPSLVDSIQTQVCKTEIHKLCRRLGYKALTSELPRNVRAVPCTWSYKVCSSASCQGLSCKDMLEFRILRSSRHVPLPATTRSIALLMLQPPCSSLHCLL